MIAKSDAVFINAHHKATRQYNNIPKDCFSLGQKFAVLKPDF